MWSHGYTKRTICCLITLVIVDYNKKFGLHYYLPSCQDLFGIMHFVTSEFLK